MENEYITINEATELLGVTRVTLYRWAKEHKLMIYKQGRNSLIKKSEAQKVKSELEQIKPLY